MIGGIQNIGRIPELQRRILFTFGMLAVYRVGAHIATPGINPEVIRQFFEQASDTVFGLFNLFSGGALEQLSIFALGIMPYISASIIFQLLQAVVPYFDLSLQHAAGDLLRAMRRPGSGERYLELIDQIREIEGVAGVLSEHPSALRLRLVVSPEEAASTASPTDSTGVPRMSPASSALGLTTVGPASQPRRSASPLASRTRPPSKLSVCAACSSSSR